MTVVVSILLLAIAVLASVLLITTALRMPPVDVADDERDDPFGPQPSRPPHRAGQVRLRSRLLFARRTLDAITLDCTLAGVDGPLPADVDPPVGLPFTIRVRCPDTTWFATRVEDLLREWATENRELVLELVPEKGKVRTTIASGGSSVHLELAGAAGLGSGLSAS